MANPEIEGASSYGAPVIAQQTVAYGPCVTVTETLISRNATPARRALARIFQTFATRHASCTLAVRLGIGWLFPLTPDGNDTAHNSEYRLSSDMGPLSKVKHGHNFLLHDISISASVSKNKCLKESSHCDDETLAFGHDYFQVGSHKAL